MVARNTTASRTTRKPPAEMPPIGAISFLDKKARKAVEKAVRVLENSAVYRVEAMGSPGAMRTYLMLKLAGLEHEEFHAIWLDAQNRVIAFDALFRGSLTATSVYPREMVKVGLAHNAAAVVFAHNHPSGEATPSLADEKLTRALKDVLSLVDIRVLDHFIVAGSATPLSFAERGLL